jgi:hypothetical protein
MKSKFLSAFFVVPFLVACGQKQELDSSTLSTASRAAPGRFAVVKACKGIMNEKWLGADKKTPVLGELDISVLTKPGTKQITAVSLRQLIPGHYNQGSSEYIHSGLFESKSAAIESINVRMVRGSTVTLMKAAPNQMVSVSTEGQTELNKLVSLEFRNGDGADFVRLNLTMLNPVTGQTINGSYYFEGCGLENIPLLKANSK